MGPFFSSSYSSAIFVVSSKCTCADRATLGVTSEITQCTWIFLCTYFGQKEKKKLHLQSFVTTEGLAHMSELFIELQLNWARK